MTSNKSASWINLEALSSITEMMNDIANKRTYVILQLIKKYQPIRVSEIRIRTSAMMGEDIHRDVISQDLMTLRSHDLVTVAKGEEDARRHYYSLNKERYAQIVKFCEDLTEGMESVNVGPGMIVS